MALNNPTPESIKQAVNGLNIDNNKNIELGGSLIEDTVINGQSFKFNLFSDLGITNDNFHLFISNDLGIGERGAGIININGDIGSTIWCYNDGISSTQINSYNTLTNTLALINTSALGFVGITSGSADMFSGITLFNDTNKGYVRIDGELTSTLGLIGQIDFTPNYTNLAFVQKIYVDNLVATIGQSFSEQTHTTGSTVTINNTSTILYVNPVSTLASLTITLPATPVNGQEVKISYGGTITTGPVVTTLTVEGNAGHTILGGSTLITADAGDGYIFKFQSSTNLWRIF